MFGTPVYKEVSNEWKANEIANVERFIKATEIEFGKAVATYEKAMYETYCAMMTAFGDVDAMKAKANSAKRQMEKVQKSLENAKAKITFLKMDMNEMESLIK